MRPWNNDVDYAASESNCCGGRNLLVARNWPLRIICMTDQAFADLIATIIDRRRKQGLALIPDWIAAEATHELDPNRISHPVIYEACRLHLRHSASGKVCTEIEEDPGKVQRDTDQLRRGAHRRLEFGRRGFRDIDH